MKSVLTASWGHLYSFAARANEEGFSQVLNIVRFTIPGVIIGGQIGPSSQAWMDPDTMKIGIPFLFIAVGVFIPATLF